MKPGFYLSPCGNHIVQLKQSSSKHFIDVIAESGGFLDFLFDICKSDIKIIFSTWERLK